MERDEVTRQIGAAPEEVWSLVADVTRMDEWSPVVTGCEWLGDASGPEVGARFVGHNRQMGAKWSRECIVTASHPGRVFAFETLFHDAPSTRWRYEFAPSETGTSVTESYEIVAMPRYVRVMRRIPGMADKSRRDARRGMEQTLERIGVIAEARA